MRTIATSCGVALLAAAVVGVIASRSGRRPPPDVPVAAKPAEVRVRAVERKGMTAESAKDVDVSAAVAAICGSDPATADRYEARSDALRSIARDRALPQSDVAALLAYVASTRDALRVERTAALKNDVLNLLRIQDKPVAGLSELLMDMCRPGKHPPEVSDYCIQHLGAMMHDDPASRDNPGIKRCLVEAAGKTSLPFSGTALLALADAGTESGADRAELKRLTLALCRPDANPAARISGIQVAGAMGCVEALPVVRGALADPHGDAMVEIVSIGTIGLLGDESDIPLLESALRRNRRRYEVAVDAALKRIGDRRAKTRVAGR